MLIPYSKDYLEGYLGRGDCFPFYAYTISSQQIGTKIIIGSNTQIFISSLLDLLVCWSGEGVDGKTEQLL